MNIELTRDEMNLLMIAVSKHLAIVGNKKRRESPAEYAARMADWNMLEDKLRLAWRQGL